MNIGTNGRMSDAHIWNSSYLKEKIETHSLNFPPASRLPNSQSNVCINYHLIGDDAFGLSRYMMKPFPNMIQGTFEEKYRMRTFDYRYSYKS